MNNDFSILKSLTILYAEDDLMIQNTITRILNMFFGKVLVASDGYEAMELFKNNSINVVLLDYVMPVFNGYEVSKEIRVHNPKIPIIIASAHTEKEKLLKAIELNLVTYIEKPILHEDLFSAFQKVIDILHTNNLLFITLNEHTKYSYISKTLFVNDKEINLSKNEVNLLELLLSKPNQLITKEMIEDIVFEEQVDENTLRNLIYRFRKKINEDFIVTIKDLGYMFKK